MEQDDATLVVRQARETEIESLAELWYQGWQDAHAAILPAELARLRTRESFAGRLRAALPTVRVVGSPERPLGFCMTRDDELYQLFVSADGRGRGVASLLEADAVSILAGRGVRLAWLACAIGNHRAARFYEKARWTRAGTMVSELETQAGMFPLEVWRFEKALDAGAAPAVGTSSSTAS
jgi:GNAT superfamily N-acetyltransferase